MFSFKSARSLLLTKLMFFICVPDQVSIRSQNLTIDKAWKAFSDVVKNFLGNMKSQNFSELVENLLQAFHNLQCNMSVKVHFFYSHLDYFPENLGAFSEE